MSKMDSILIKTFFISLIQRSKKVVIMMVMMSSSFRTLQLKINCHQQQ